MLRIAAIIFFWYGPCLEFTIFRRAELQLGRSQFVRSWALAPEASGVKTPDPRTLTVRTEVPTSETALSTDILQITRVPIFSISWLGPTWLYKFC